MQGLEKGHFSKDIQTASKYLKRCSASLAIAEELMKTTDTTSHLLGWVHSRNGKWQILEKIWRNWNACALLVGIGNGALAVETSGDFSKGYTHTCPGHSHVCQVYMKLSSHTHVHMDTIHNSQQTRQHKCPVTEQVDETSVCRMDYISAIKCGSLVSATR